VRLRRMQRVAINVEVRRGALSCRGTSCSRPAPWRLLYVLRGVLRASRGLVRAEVACGEATRIGEVRLIRRVRLGAEDVRREPGQGSSPMTTRCPCA